MDKFLLKILLPNHKIK